MLVPTIIFALLAICLTIQSFTSNRSVNDNDNRGSRVRRGLSYSITSQI
jgi:hypothetical protein